jgi:hypothetical protein
MISQILNVTNSKKTQQNMNKKIKLQFVMRNSKINNFEVKVHTPLLNCCIIKLFEYEKNKM